MWQQVVIVLIVIVAAGYVSWTFLTMRIRQQLLDVAAARGLLVGLAQRHRARMNTPGCSNCSASDQPHMPRSQKL